MSTHLSVCLGAVHVVQHLLGPQPLQRMLHSHHTLILQSYNAWARRRALCHLHMHTCTHNCEAVLPQWTNPVVQNSEETGMDSTGRGPIAARFTHTSDDAVHVFSEQLHKLGPNQLATH